MECTTHVLRAVINRVSKHLSPATEQSRRGVSVREHAEHACVCARAPVRACPHPHGPFGRGRVSTAAKMEQNEDHRSQEGELGDRAGPKWMQLSGICDLPPAMS